MYEWIFSREYTHVTSIHIQGAVCYQHLRSKPSWSLFWHPPCLLLPEQLLSWIDWFYLKIKSLRFLWQQSHQGPSGRGRWSHHRQERRALSHRGLFSGLETYGICLLVFILACLGLMAPFFLPVFPFCIENVLSDTCSTPVFLETDKLLSNFIHPLMKKSFALGSMAPESP